MDLHRPEEKALSALPSGLAGVKALGTYAEMRASAMLLTPHRPAVSRAVFSEAKAKVAENFLNSPGHRARLCLGPPSQTVSLQRLGPRLTVLTMDAMPE